MKDLAARLLDVATAFCAEANIELTTLGRWICKDPNLFIRRIHTDLRFSTYEMARDWLSKYHPEPEMRGRRPDKRPGGQQ